MASGTSDFKWHGGLYPQTTILIGLQNGLFKINYLNIRECLPNTVILVLV